MTDHPHATGACCLGPLQLREENRRDREAWEAAASAHREALRINRQRIALAQDSHQAALAALRAANLAAMQEAHREHEVGAGGDRGGGVGRMGVGVRCL